MMGIVAVKSAGYVLGTFSYFVFPTSVVLKWLVVDTGKAYLHAFH